MAVTWVAAATVASRVGVASNDTVLLQVTAAANQWAYDARAGAGWTDTGWLDDGDPEADDTSPSDSVTLGVIELAVQLWKLANTRTSYTLDDGTIEGVVAAHPYLRSMLSTTRPTVT